MLACSKFMGRASACSGGLEVFGVVRAIAGSF